MFNPSFITELLPYFHRAVPRFCNVIGNIGHLVAELFGPTVFVFSAHLLASWIVMIRTEVKSINAPYALMNKYVG